MRYSYYYIPFVFDLQDRRPVFYSPHEHIYSLPYLRRYAQIVSSSFESESAVFYFFRVRRGSSNITLLRFDADMRIEKCPITSVIVGFLVDTLKYGYSLD